MDIDSVWEKIKRGLKDGAALSMEKIEEYTKIGKLKIEELAAKRKIERNYMDIGEQAFDLIEAGKGSEIAGDLTVKKAIENIISLKKDIAEIARKIEQISEESKKAKARSESDEEVSGI
jgi:hypothetical protein